MSSFWQWLLGQKDKVYPSPRLVQAALFSRDSRRVLRAATLEAAALRHEYIGTEHLLLALFQDPKAAVPTICAMHGATPGQVRDAVLQALVPGPERNLIGALPPTPRVLAAIRYAVFEVSGQEEVEPHHLLLGLVREQEGIAGSVLWSLLRRPEDSLSTLLADLRQKFILYGPK